MIAHNATAGLHRLRAVWFRLHMRRRADLLGVKAVAAQMRDEGYTIEEVIKVLA